MFVLTSDPGIGDNVSMIPAIHALADQAHARDEFLYLDMMNAHVRATFYHPRLRPLREMRTGRRRVDFINLGRLENSRGTMEYHPIVGYLRQAGFEADEPVQPRIEISSFPRVPTYDVLIAPWSVSAFRSLHSGEIERIAIEFASHWERPRIAILGAPSDPRLVIPPLERQALNLSYAYGSPLREVARMMQQAKVVVTVDSGPSRLAYAAGVQNHIVLLPEDIPPVWGGHPGARVIFGRANWSPERILEAALQPA